MANRLEFISDETALGECQRNVEKGWSVVVKIINLGEEIKNEKEMHDVLVNAIIDAKEEGEVLGGYLLNRTRSKNQK